MKPFMDTDVGMCMFGFVWVILICFVYNMGCIQYGLYTIIWVVYYMGVYSIFNTIWVVYYMDFVLYELYAI